jgi:hypothetical protein
MHGNKIKQKKIILGQKIEKLPSEKNLHAECREAVLVSTIENYNGSDGDAPHHRVIPKVIFFRDEKRIAKREK